MMTEEEKDELTEILKNFLSNVTHYYKIKEAYYSDIEVGELEFFEILKKLRLIKVPDEFSTEEYLKFLFDKFSITKNTSPKELKGFRLSLFGFPKPFYKENESEEQISIYPFFRRFKFSLKEITTLDPYRATAIANQFMTKTFSLGFIYLNALRHPTEENIASLIRHYKFDINAKGRTKINESMEKSKKIA